MADAFRAVWQNPYVRVAALLLLFLLGLLFLFVTWRVWRLLLVAGLLAALVHPLKARLVRLGAPRAVAYGLVVAGLFLALALFWAGLLAVVGQLVGYAGNLPEELSRGLRALSRYWERGISLAPDWAQPALVALPGELGAEFRRALAGGLFYLEEWLRSGLLPALSALVGGVVDLVVGLFLFLYLLWDGERILAGALRLAPTALRPALLWTGEALEHAVLGYFRGQALVAASMGFFVGLGLYLLRLPMPAAVGFLVAVFELVPFLGVALGMALTALAALGQGPFATLLALSVFVVAGEFEGHVLGPLIMARATQLHPVTVLLALLLGADLAGFWGAVAAVPTAAFLKHALLHFWLQRS